MCHNLVAVLLLVTLTACAGSGGNVVSSPCDLTDAALVQSVFGGTVADGVEGEARNCQFDVVGGSVVWVSVFDFGGADGWEGTRQGYVDNRGGVTDVEGLGDAAFFPNDIGPASLVVQSGGQIFSVTVFTDFQEPTDQVISAVAVLADAIAQDLAS